MATYQWVNRDTFSLDELVMYGSSRLGTYGVNAVLCDTVTRDSAWCAEHDTSTNPFTDSVTYFTAGIKQYEFTNHLGNVLLTLTDRHIPFYFGGVSYIAEVASAQDYYPFGMEMVGRAYNPAIYRFGFNGGSEKDNEIYGVGNAISTDFRENDPRLGGRWWSPDRVVKPWESPYAGYSDNPIVFNDPDGLDPGDPVKKDDGSGDKGSTATNGGTKNGEGAIEGGTPMCLLCGEHGERTWGEVDPKSGANDPAPSAENSSRSETSSTTEQTPVNDGAGNIKKEQSYSSPEAKLLAEHPYTAWSYTPGYWGSQEQKSFEQGSNDAAKFWINAVTGPELIAGGISVVSAASARLLLTGSADVAGQSAANLSIRADIVLQGGRGGQLVKTLKGPASSVLKGAAGRIYITDDLGQVIWDITAKRAKSVIPGRGFGPKVAPTQEQLDLLEKVWGKL